MASKTKRAAIYLRVSTTGQTVENQRRELEQVEHLQATGVDLYLDQQNIDTTTPAGKLLFQVTGAFAEFERSMIRQRVNAGLSRAKAQGKRLGRPQVDHRVAVRVRAELTKGTGILKTAKALGIGVGTVQRIKRD